MVPPRSHAVLIVLNALHYDPVVVMVITPSYDSHHLFVVVNRFVDQLHLMECFLNVNEDLKSAKLFLSHSVLPQGQFLDTLLDRCLITEPHQDRSKCYCFSLKDQ